MDRKRRQLHFVAPGSKPMLRSARSLLVLLIAIGLSLIAWQSARMQSPLRRITNTTEEGISLNPSISGDGRVLAFESTEDIAHAGGGESFRGIRSNIGIDPPTFLQMGATRAPAAAVSQDGSRIAFASKDDPLGTNPDGNSEIFLYDGARLIQVTNTSPGDIANRITNGNFQPSISDDGRYIAFSSNRQFGGQNADGNLEIFVYDVTAQSFAQLTNSSGVVGSSDAKISGNGNDVAYIFDGAATPGNTRNLLIQARNGSTPVRTLAQNVQSLAVTYGRAISDDGQRVVWSAQTAANTTQVFLFDGRAGNTTRQITSLASRVTEVPLHPTISGDGSRIAFATRRTVSGAGSNSDGGVELYTYDIPSSTFGRVTNVTASGATADVVSSLNDDGSVIAFNFPRILSGPLTNNDFANNSEIYVSGTPARPAFGQLAVLNGASFGHEPASTKAVAPDSIAVALGNNLANTTQQTQRGPGGTFPTNVNGTTLTVNGRPAQIFFVSPTQINFHVPAATEIGTAEVIVTNPDGFPSRATVTTLRAAPGVFTYPGDGTGEGVILDANTLQRGPFDPSTGNLRLIIFSTGVRNATTVSVTAGGRALTFESTVQTANMPGMDEIHVLVPADLRGAGQVELVIRADARDSNPVTVEFTGDSRRDVMINEFLADPPDGLAGDANHDGVRDSGDDEFVELVNTTTHDIDLFGYRLLTRSSTSSTDTVRHEFVAGYILPACTSLVLFGGGNPNRNDPIFGGAQVYKTQTGSLSLTNSGGVITLRDRAGVTADSVAYGSGGLNSDANQSLTRSPDITGPFTLHQSASGSGGRLFSPGTRVNASPFALCSPISRIEITPTTATIEAGQKQQFTAHTFDASGTEIFGVVFLWTSTNITVAGIDQNGLATGFTPGTTEIRAFGRGVTSGTPAVLTVNQGTPVLTSVTISPATATIGVGEMQQYTAQAKDQFGQNIGGVTISFASNNTTVATIDSLTATSSAGSAAATVTGRASGTAQITATATNGGTNVNSTPATLTVEPAAGQLLISEFRTRGPNGSADELVEIYNPTTSPQRIGGLRIRASNGSGTISDRVTIIAGTILGPGCHYLFANISSGGYSASIPPDQTYGAGITDDGGIAITGSNGTRIIDAVGMSNGSAYKEGTPLTPLTGTENASYERKPGLGFGNGRDTNNNAADFVIQQSTPQNSLTGCFATSSANLSVVKDDSPDPVTTGTNLTYTLTVVNHGAADAQNVVVTDHLPAGVSFVSCNSTGAGVCGGSGNDRTVTFASLLSGTIETITLVVTVNAAPGETVTNTATISSATPDNNISNNSDTSTTVVQAVLPTLTINDISLNEGDSGTTRFTFTVSLSTPAPAGGVTFDIATQDNGAVAPGDYMARSLTGQTIPEGETSYTFDVAVNGDALVEHDEIFHAVVTNVTNALVGDGQGNATIQNDDTANLVISQLYAGGGNAGAQYTNDFVEIFNRGTTTVDFNVTNYSVQYAGATAAFTTNKVDLGFGTIAPGQYFLVQLSSGGSNGVPLPTPDASGSINLASTAGKVALVAGAGFLSGSGCPLAGTVADFVGYGTTADCFEGSGRAPAPSNTTADVRKNGGCTDTNDNAADFLVTAPFPRNTSSPLNQCTGALPPTISIDSVSVTEGNSGTTTATFTVSLSGPAQGSDVTFDIATQNDTATTANNDYVAKSLTNQIIPVGQQGYSFTVTVNGDVAVEPSETFFVNLTNVAGATPGTVQGTGTILNDDLPALSIHDVAQNEGNAGTTVFSFTVSLSAPAPAAVTFDIATQDNTATLADNDYAARSLTSQTIPAGSSTYTFDVNVNGDLNIEANEIFLVNVTNVLGATVADGQGQGTILNDDSPVLSINDVTQTEGDTGTKTFTFTVSSSLPAPAGGITFDIATEDSTATVANNDYVSRSLTGQTIPAGQQTYTFDVTVNGDKLVEPDEIFRVRLSNVANATPGDVAGDGTIQNDDVALLRITQIYGGGNNSGATFQNDFVELFNAGGTTINFAVTPYLIQYTSASGTFSASNTIALTSGTLVPGQYFLIKLAGGTTNGAALPAADATDTTINMSATDGKVALVAGTTPIAGSGCPIGATVADFIGYGSPNCAETTATAALSATKSARRTNSCVDTHNNAADFTVVTNPSAPRNSLSPLNDCTAAPLPDLTINDVSLAEGNASTTTTFTFTVSLSTPAPAGGVTFDIGAADNTATVAESDYVAHSLTSQTIPSGNSSYTFDVTVNGDTNVEPDETFFVNVTNVTGANVVDGQGQGTIQNDDAAVPLPNLSINDVSLNEGNTGTTTYTFTVSLSAAAPAGGVAFDIGTQDSSATTAGNDYVAHSLTAQSIAAGNTTYTFDVSVNADLLVENNETFLVNVSNVTNANVTDGQGQGTITNDDTANLVISQVYGGGSNSGAAYANDFVQIFNRGATIVDFFITAYSVQYASSAGTFSSANKVDLTSGTLVPGQYFLIKLAPASPTTGTAFTADVTNTAINMSATDGKVALVLGTTVATTTAGCPTAVTVADLLGYGAANCAEGTAPAALSATKVAVRNANGCTDTGNNSTDFTVVTVNTSSAVPKNSLAPPSPCP